MAGTLPSQSLKPPGWPTGFRLPLVARVSWRLCQLPRGMARWRGGNSDLSSESLQVV